MNCSKNHIDSDIQKKIDYEIRMRDGACKLLAACSQRDQALEASKSLLTCNARIMAYMSELQRKKEAQVLQRAVRRSSDGGPRLPCKGKVAISDLRIPLMWKDTEYFKNKGELHRCAVFCLLQLDGEIYDTDMVMVDRTLTDICFDNTVVFTEASPEFELRVELYSCCTEDEFSTCSTPRKLASKLSSSLGRSTGKKMRAAMEPSICNPANNGGAATILLPMPAVPGPKYNVLAHTSLTLAHVQDSFRTHDLSISGNEECTYWLPLYGSMCCRLAAQPYCMTEQMMSGYLKVKPLGGDHQSWTKVYSVLKGTNLFCYHKEEDMQANVEPAFTIAINKETKIRATEKDVHCKGQSINISNRYGGEEVTHTLGTESREDMQRWMEAFWQQFYDMSQWKQCCDDVMKIETPSPRKPAIITAKQQGSLYNEMVIDASDDIGMVTDILARRRQALHQRTQPRAAPHWMCVFEDPAGHYSPQRLTQLCSTSVCRGSLWDSAGPRTAGPSSPRSLSEPLGRFRSHTFSLDTRLSSRNSHACNGGLRCALQPAFSPSSSLTPQTAFFCSASTSSNSSSEGSYSLDFEGDSIFRLTSARHSLRNLRAKLDPRNWLQSHI
ncbi:rhotekin isoform X3 [Brienomyrus brachyistius]|uniref:rhotekin isoform X3 n=1 Tax=Brienomyrus brachyistius TaxID=42636 RepID=UPI0020B390E5|nr:rhotekin isoform X3 [Brienomyrus brachyistius]